MVPLTPKWGAGEHPDRDDASVTDLRWEDVARYFEDDGSLLDAYVFNTSLTDWQSVLDVVRSLGWPLDYAAARELVDAATPDDWWLPRCRAAVIARGEPHEGAPPPGTRMLGASPVEASAEGLAHDRARAGRPKRPSLQEP
jgi:hypothetical protein